MGRPGATQVLLLLWLLDAGVMTIIHGFSLQSSLMHLDNQTKEANTSECEGLVLLSFNGTPSLVCDEHWNASSSLAQVICREAGCGPPVSKWLNPSFQGPSMPAVRGVQCKGTESNTSECQQLGDDIVEDCNQEHIATLTCSRNFTTQLDNEVNETVRLVGGRSKCEGHLQLLHEERWGFLCSSALQQKKAYILCKQIGCIAQQISITSTSHNPHYGEVVPVWPADILCQGNESSLLECQREASNSCISGEHVYLHCFGGRLEESWLVWMAIIFAALMIVLFCWIKVIKSWKGCVHTVKKHGLACFTYMGNLWTKCCGTPDRRRRKYLREPPEVRVEETQSPPGSPSIIQNAAEVNALLAPHGFRLNNTITPPPSYMNALKVLSRPLENTQTPPPSYLEALKILSRPIIVHVPADTSAEEEELITSKPNEKYDQ